MVKKQKDAEAYRDECTRLEPEFLDEEFVRISSDISYWSEQYANAVERYLIAYAERKRMFGELINDPLLLDELEHRLNKKPNASQIEGWILNDPRYREAVTEEAAAQREKVRMQGVMNALSAKRDALISLGANVRVERQREPFIMDE